MAFRSFGEQSSYYFKQPHTEIPAAPVKSNADWRGPHMKARPGDWTVTLTAEDIAEVSAAADKAHAAGIAMEKINRDNFQLTALGDRIADWRVRIRDGAGFVLVRGLPVKDWGVEKSTLAYWGIGHYLGVPGAQNPDNELLGHVIDYSEERTNPLVRRYRTAGNIDFHCDAADVVGLLCLNAAKAGGQSRIASSVAIFNEIFRSRPDLVPRLFEPFMTDRRGEEKEGQRGWYPQAVCRYADGVLRSFYHSEYMRSAARFSETGRHDETTLAVLDLYDTLAASEDFYLDMVLEPGDMQFISNHSIVHARTEYQDFPERERRRHLLRLWLSME